MVGEEIFSRHKFLRLLRKLLSLARNRLAYSGCMQCCKDRGVLLEPFKSRCIRGTALRQHVHQLPFAVASGNSQELCIEVPHRILPSYLRQNIAAVTEVYLVRTVGRYPVEYEARQRVAASPGAALCEGLDSMLLPR